MTGAQPLQEQALGAYLAALTAVDGTKRVKAHVRTGALDELLEDRNDPRRIKLLALGKAAPAMLWGLVEANVPFEGIGVAPKQRTRPTVDTFRWLDGDHPVPGELSFEAGLRILEWVQSLPKDAPLLVLLSGGASSLLEIPADGDQEACVQAWRDDLQAGWPVVEMNRRRAMRSAIKGGRLGQAILERTDRAQVWLLGDTPPGTEREAVASGLFWHDGGAIPHTVLANNDDLVAGAAAALGGSGWNAYRHARRVEGPVETEVEAFLEALDGLPPEQEVALVAGGEATLTLPDDAPPGGRCQHAALVAARHLDQRRSAAVFLAAGSDGIDGTTREAGAWADCNVWDPAAEEALETLDAHAFLHATGHTVRTGHSSTNVNDLWIALRPALSEAVDVEGPTARGPLVVE